MIRRNCSSVKYGCRWRLRGAQHGWLVDDQGLLFVWAGRRRRLLLPDAGSSRQRPGGDGHGRSRAGPLQLRSLRAYDASQRNLYVRDRLHGASRARTERLAAGPFSRLLGGTRAVDQRRSEQYDRRTQSPSVRPQRSCHAHRSDRGSVDRPLYRGARLDRWGGRGTAGAAAGAAAAAGSAGIAIPAIPGGAAGGAAAGGAAGAAVGYLNCVALPNLICSVWSKLHDRWITEDRDIPEPTGDCKAVIAACRQACQDDGGWQGRGSDAWLWIANCTRECAAKQGCIY